MDDIRAAAIERLTTHKERLIEEKIMKGKAVRALLNVVVGGPEEIATVMETEKARKRAEMQAAGETREIIFDEPLVIVTGVPRWERDEEYAAALERGDYKVPVWPVMKAETPAETKPKASPAELSPPEPVVASEPRYVQAQVRPPNPERNDPGEIREARYTVFSDGTVRVEGLDGRLIGVTQIQPGDDAEAASRMLLRDKHGKDGAFYDAINYPRPRWVI